MFWVVYGLSYVILRWLSAELVWFVGWGVFDVCWFFVSVLDCCFVV